MNIRILELGSNSFQLHGFTVTSAGSVRHRWELKRVVALADGLGDDGLLEPAYAERGLRAVRELLQASPDEHPMICFGTSAVREARNRELLLGPMARELGFVPRVLSGSEEARLAYAGALTSLDGPVHRLCVVDIGGGSTELAVGDHLGVGLAHSARVGALLGEGAMRAFERSMVPVLRRIALYGPDRLVFASGVARAMKRLLTAQGLLAPHAPIPTQLVEQLLPMLPALGREDLSRLGVPTTRLRTLPTGVKLMVAIARELSLPYIDVCSGGLREGAALREWSRLRLRPAMSRGRLSDLPPPLPFAALASKTSPSIVGVSGV